ncbi:autotransporter outer membrane beta-barrel domain-containing protein [Pelagibacterales bacterium SAG-MED47]|nr:autotransporter outer membrane beta-barrel domain-containing protein [Pelagibacterales bacterium SAG-MED47]
MKLINVLLLFLLVFQFTNLKAGTVNPVFKQLKDPNLDGDNNEPSTSGIAISLDGKKMFVMDNLSAGDTDGGAIFIYDLTTAFDISTMDVPNRTIVNTTGLGDNLGFGNGKKTIAFNNDGKKLFLFNSHGLAQFHNLASPYDVASISASTLIPDDGLNYKSAYNSGALEIDALYGVAFNNDGTRMYLNDGSKNTTDITQVNLSTPFDPSSGTFAFNLNTEDIPDLTTNRFTFEIAFDDDGTRLYISEGLNNSTAIPTFIYVYKLSTPFELSSATYVGNSQIVGNGNNVSAIGWTFGNNGMKAYIGTEDANADGDDIIYEYDLTCPYGIVICETETASVIGAQVEIAKNVIHQNTSTIFKRFEWLRRNENKTNLNSHNLKLNINNPILTSLTNKLQSSLKDLKYTQASLKTEKPSNDKRKWSSWTHGDISFGRVGDTISLKPKEITTKGISIGTDKLTKNDNFLGFAMRYSNDDVDIKSGTNEELNSQSLSFNIYSQLPINSSNLNALLGVSFLSIDKMISGTVTGERNGKQIYTALSFEKEKNYDKFDIIPYGKTELGVTQLSEYTDFGTAATNNVETHERLTFKTGNASAGLKFDHTSYMDESRLSRNGFLEYMVDFTSDIDHHYKNHIDNVTVQNTIKRYSLNNIKGNIGYELLQKSGHTFALNYERFQSLDNSAHTDSLLFKFGKQKNENTNFNVIYDPLKNNNTEISYLKNYDNFNLKVKSNYAMYNNIPDYGAGIELSATF